MLVFILSPEHVPENVPGKGMVQGMWERQGLKKNIAWFPAPMSTLHPINSCSPPTGGWRGCRHCLLCKLSGKELREPWVCTGRQSSQGMEVGWEEGLLQVGCSRNKRKSGETEIKELGGPSSLT